LKRWIFSISLFFVLLEVALRITGIYSTFSETVGAGYVTYYNQTDTDHYHTWTPNYEILYDQPEFKYRYMANSLGLREKEMPLHKSDSVFRLICIGDSFTEGDGAEYEDAYPRFLEKKLNAEADSSVRYEVYNAGVCGSDMFFMNRILEEKLFAYQPDAVIYLINNSDVNDIIFRGGNERFLADGTTKFKSAPWFHAIFRFSHVARLILQEFFTIDNSSLLPKKKMEFARVKAINLIAQEMATAKKMCASRKVKCAFIIQPVPTDNFALMAQQILSNGNGMGGTKKSLKLLAEKMPNETALINQVQMNNTLLPLTKAYANIKIEEYAWPVNGHFNAKGYAILANQIYNQVTLSDSTFFYRYTRIK